MCILIGNFFYYHHLNLFGLCTVLIWWCYIFFVSVRVLYDQSLIYLCLAFPLNYPFLKLKLREISGPFMLCHLWVNTKKKSINLLENFTFCLPTDISLQANVEGCWQDACERNQSKNFRNKAIHTFVHKGPWRATTCASGTCLFESLILSTNDPIFHRAVSPIAT